MGSDPLISIDSGSFWNTLKYEIDKYKENE